MQVEQKPADAGVSGWQAILPRRQPAAPLSDDIVTDYLVVGAGFAGLSAARRLSQLAPSASIAILEAQEVATGPAGRNSGFMIDLPHALATGNYEGENSKDLRNIRMNRAAIAFAADAAREYQFSPECLNPAGKINASASRAGDRHNQSYARHLESLGEPFELLNAAEMQETCGSGYYRGGLKTPGTAILQPALYIASLADALQQMPTCHLFENSALLQLESLDDRWRARTAGGTVTASRVILAVNGLIETFGFYQHRLMHINLYASMTRELDATETERLGGQARWGFTPSDPIGSTVRRIDDTGGTRLVIRNQCSYEAGLSLPRGRLQQVARDHASTFAARFPMLPNVEMEYCWAGRLCLSRNDVWAMGELKPGLFSACCQNGLGTTRGTIAGIIAAEMAFGRSADSLIPDYVPEAEPSRLYPEPFMTLGARSVIKLKQWSAGREL